MQTVLCDFPNTYNKFKIDEYLNSISNKINLKDIAGIIIEPVLSEGGDLHASNKFFRELRNICAKFNTTFIVDEVQTGMGATGKLWSHEHWELDTPPDIVTFAKKAQISGFFANEKY